MRNFLLFLILAACSSMVSADERVFTKGPVFTEYGPVADVEVTLPIPPDTVFKHSFDVSSPAPVGEPNRALVSVARFINMHARVGVAKDDIRPAVVVHGKAVKEMADKKSAGADLVASLIDYGVRIIVCGQSAAYYEAATDDLLPGIEMALSAMTAHALLQQQGFALNPF